VIGGEESIWFNAKKAGVTPTDLFKPFPNEASKQDSGISLTTLPRLPSLIGSDTRSLHSRRCQRIISTFVCGVHCRMSKAN
jgi:hypothetical protein